MWKGTSKIASKDIVFRSMCNHFLSSIDWTYWLTSNEYWICQKWWEITSELAYRRNVASVWVFILSHSLACSFWRNQLLYYQLTYGETKWQKSEREASSQEPARDFQLSSRKWILSTTTHMILEADSSPPESFDSYTPQFMLK